MPPTHSMDRRQLLIICICFSLTMFDAISTIGIMPVHVVRLGADPAATGLYMAFAFFGVTAGNILGGWLTDRIGQRKRITQVSYVLWIPAALLLTQATTVPGIILTAGLMWLPGGVTVAALNSILGLSAGEHERGRVFGWVALASGLGSFLGGLIGGAIAEQWGFHTLFVVMAVLPAFMLLITTTLRNVVAPSKTTALARQDTSAGPGSLVYLLLAATFIARLGANISDLGRPLVMLQLNMDAADVANAIAFSSAITLPLPLILGWLSDRVGRKGLLILFYSVAAAGLLLLRAASAPWHFWLSAALVNTINSSGGVGQAYVSDLSDPKTIGRSLSLLTSSNFIASMIGLGGAGYMMQAITIETTLLFGTASLVIAMFILLRMPAAAPKLAGDTLSS